MPIYEYQCRACGHLFDALQKLSDEPLTECPECHEPQLRKLVSAPNFRLKGGGWYETDFKDKNKRNIAGDTASDSTAGGDGAGKSDAAGKSGDSDAGSSKTARPDKPAAGGAASPAAAAPKSTD